MDLIAQIEPAQRGPGKLAMRHAAALHLQQHERVIFAFRFVFVDQIRAPRHHFGDPVLLAEEIARRLDAVASEVVQRSAARIVDVPKMRTVRAAVGLAGRTHSRRPMPPLSTLSFARTTAGAKTSVSA